MTTGHSSDRESPRVICGFPLSATTVETVEWCGAAAENHGRPDALEGVA
jgi:hypothetical protein